MVSVVYCSLETPAMSAAPYAHQWHAKPNILGLNLSPVLILISLLRQQSLRFQKRSSLAKNQNLPFVDGHSLVDFNKGWNRRINLAKNLFIGIVL
jgi:hypothetical protein